LPVESVTPRMIRATNHVIVAVLAHELRAPVAADVVERAQLALAIARDEERLPGQRRHERVAGLRNLRRTADTHPTARPDALLFDAIKFLRAIRVGHDRRGERDR